MKRTLASILAPAIGLVALASPSLARAATPPAPAARTPVRVCVEVVSKTFGDPTPPAASAAPTAPAAPVAQPSAPDAPAPVAQPLTPRFRPETYLTRLLEYEVTHAAAYEAVSEKCQERLTVELYPLAAGWTAFGRFTRFAREEKVDVVFADELASLAERMAKALLDDRPIEATISRKNVLRADSETQSRRIEGASYGELALGTTLRLGSLPTAPDDPDAAASTHLRIFTPVAIAAGVRREMREWGVEALGGLSFGTSERAVSKNQTGGHADYSWGTSASLHFLRYADANAMNSFYVGGGATFELSRFTFIRPSKARTNDSRDSAWTGGLDADLLVGCEFLRASSTHFFTQLDVSLPAYVVATETDAGEIHSWLPGATARVGILF